VSGFTQAPPELGNQYRDDGVLRSTLRRLLPADVLEEIEPELDAMGELAGGELHRFQLADRPNEPRLVQWSPWGERVDRLEPTPLWRRAERLAAERGLVAIPYEARHGRFSRLHQMALVHLFHPSTDVYTCPLAMTDGAARTLLAHGHPALVERAVPRLTSRDPATFWTSGQWMTETTGGSDVGRSETVARRGDDGRWRLFGRKWFTSAAASPMTLTLARPEGNPPGGRGLALFYLETRDADGRPNGLTVDRLKDKLGTRKLPTAEITLDGAVAEAVAGTSDGVRAMVPMLVLTRTWNAVSAVSFMRRGLALAHDYARRRVAFGAPLAEKPLHVDTLAGLEAEAQGAFHLAFRLVDLVGRQEAGELDEAGERLLRVLLPVAKATTARQAVAVASEAIEAFGGAGYVEDTGLPVLLRDSQVLSIWEGTTNVLALDALRAFGRDEAEARAVAAAVAAEVERAAGAHGGGEIAALAALAAPADAARAAARRALGWLDEVSRAGDTAGREAGARRFALTLGRALEAALAVEHARWALEHVGDGRPAAAARRLAAHGLDLVAAPGAFDAADARALAGDEAVPRPATSPDVVGASPRAGQIV
jgi:acyl-CoA dehydrogenase